MRFTPLEISEVLVIEPQLFEDERGFLLETYHKKRLADAGIVADFVQDNQSGSRRGALRGLHYQIRQPQGKLMRVIIGESFHVAVDLRRSSSTFLRWAAARLSGTRRQQLWIPPGFAHGFFVLSEWAELLYSTTDYYAPQWERSLLWNDPTIGIEWPLLDGEEPILSERDQKGTPLSEAEVYD